MIFLEKKKKKKKKKKKTRYNSAAGVQVFGKFVVVIRADEREFFQRSWVYSWKCWSGARGRTRDHILAQNFSFYYKSFLANFTDFEPEIRPNHANIDTFFFVFWLGGVEKAKGGAKRGGREKSLRKRIFMNFVSVSKKRILFSFPLHFLARICARICARI